MQAKGGKGEVNDIVYDGRQIHVARGTEQAAEAGGVGGCEQRPGGRSSVPKRRRGVGLTERCDETVGGT